MAKKVKTTEENRESVKKAIQDAYPQYFETEAPEGTLKVITTNGLEFLDPTEADEQSLVWDDAEGALLTKEAAKVTLNRYDYSRIFGIGSMGGAITVRRKDHNRNEAIKGAIFSFIDRLPESDKDRAADALKLLAECLQSTSNKDKHARITADILNLTAEFLRP